MDNIRQPIDILMTRVLNTALDNAQMGFLEGAIETIVHAGGAVNFSGITEPGRWYCHVYIVTDPDDADRWPVGSAFGPIMQDALINAITEALS